MMDRKRNKTSARALIHKARLAHENIIKNYVIGHGENVLKHFQQWMLISSKLSLDK